MFLLCQILLPAGSEASSALLTPIAREAKTPESLKLKASKEAGKKKQKPNQKSNGCQSSFQTVIVFLLVAGNQEQRSRHWIKPGKENQSAHEPCRRFCCEWTHSQVSWQVGSSKTFVPDRPRSRLPSGNKVGVICRITHSEIKETTQGSSEGGWRRVEGTAGTGRLDTPPKSLSCVQVFTVGTESPWPG